MPRWSSGQDVALSRLNRGFDSPTRYQPTRVSLSMDGLARSFYSRLSLLVVSATTLIMVTIFAELKKVASQCDMPLLCAHEWRKLIGCIRNAVSTTDQNPLMAGWWAISSYLPSTATHRVNY